MMSGILNRRGFSGVAGTSRAKTFPALVISTDSPWTIQAATRGKRFRKSLTVAVFIVRLNCLTCPRMSTASKDDMVMALVPAADDDQADRQLEGIPKASAQSAVVAGRSRRE